MNADSPLPRDDPPGLAWAQLRRPVFRMLWLAWATASVCMWMNDVAAAWLMTSLSDSPLMVALVQSAATLPMFLLGLPSGALADILDRRRYFIATQFWVATIGLVLFLTSLAGALTAPLLLTLTFLNGFGLAMRWPVFAALVPEVVPRKELSSALALNVVAMNGARIVGPMVAGALIAAAGTTWVFLLNAVLSIAVGIVLIRWRRAPLASTLPSERFFSAIRVGVQYVRQSPSMHSAMLRVVVFFLSSAAQMALLPLVAKGLPGGGANTFSLLLAAMGLGAIVAATYLPRLRERLSRDQLVWIGTLVHAVAVLTLAYAPNAYVAVPAMLVAGFAWISVLNSLTVAAQMALPDWVRARGMSIYQTTMMGAGAMGSALWGQVAAMSDVRTSLTLAVGCGLAALLLTRRFKVGGRADEDLTPARVWTEPEVAIPIEPDQGPVLVTIEYRIDPARADEFAEVLRESRRLRLRNGAISWGLYRDTADPARYVEHFVDESWVEHMRQHDRVTNFDILLRDRKRAFHLGEGGPVVSHFVAKAVGGR